MLRKKAFMTNLGRACNILYVAESLPECGRCADMIRSARVLLEETLIDLSKKKRSALDWKTMSEVVQFLTRLLSLVKLIVLGGNSSFCQWWMVNLYVFN